MDAKGLPSCHPPSVSLQEPACFYTCPSKTLTAAGGGEHERMQLPALDEGLALTPCCLAAASQERVVLATAEGVAQGQVDAASAYAHASACLVTMPDEPWQSGAPKLHCLAVMLLRQSVMPVL